VAKDIVDRGGAVNFRAAIVDWPGLGFSDWPSLNYNADVMEDFLVKLITFPDSPVKSSGKRCLHYPMMVHNITMDISCPVITGCSHPSAHNNQDSSTAR
jgi:hypothetical protein